MLEQAVMSKGGWKCCMRVGCCNYKYGGQGGPIEKGHSNKD